MASEDTGCGATAGGGPGCPGAVSGVSRGCLRGVLGVSPGCPREHPCPGGGGLSAGPGMGWRDGDLGGDPDADPGMDPSLWSNFSRWSCPGSAGGVGRWGLGGRGCWTRPGNAGTVSVPATADGVLSPAGSGLELEESGKSGGKKLDAMTLIKEGKAPSFGEKTRRFGAVTLPPAPRAVPRR